MNAKIRTHSSVDGLALWILLSCWCSLSGWGLSAIGCLNVTGYGIAFLGFILVLGLFHQPLGLIRQVPGKIKCHPIQSRKWLPKLWLLLALLTGIGGLLYHPNNFDYLFYRFPRILHWCWEQKWYWIDTTNARMNFSATGFEWLMVPLFVAFKTDRLFFLINFISFLFLPGLIFSVFCGLGISKRISWWWMWVLPSGYCYALQAGGVGNDSFAMVYLFAALHYVFRAKESSGSKDFLFSCLAIALLTGTKATNVPLMLPWLIAVFFHRKQLLGVVKPLALMVTVLVALIVSFLPMAMLNTHFTGDYAGDPQNITRVKVPSPVSAVMGNTIEIAEFNLSPPIWYKSPSWKKIVPDSIRERLKRDYPRMDYFSGEMQIEERTGVGLGIVVCTILMAGFGLWAWMAQPGLLARHNHQALWISAGTALAFAAYLAKIGSEAGARLVTAYYPLLIAGVLVLAALDGRVIKRPLFYIVGIAALASSLLLVVLSPSRPLFPSGLVAQYLAKVSPHSVARYNGVYGVYALRFDALKDLRSYIPENEKAIGYLECWEEPEASLWRPFGARQVISVSKEESADDLKAHNVHYVVVDRSAFEQVYHVNMDDFIQKWSGTIVGEKELGVKVRDGKRIWIVIHCQ